jgi:ATP-dependent Lon protease
MTRESQSKLSKNENKRVKKHEEINKKKKKVETSDSDNDLSESESESDDLDPEMDTHEYRKFIQKIFPSKNLSKKIAAGEKLKKVMDDSDNWETDDSSTKESENKHSKNQKLKMPTKPTSKEQKEQKKKKEQKENSDNEEISLGDEDTEEDDNFEPEHKNKKSRKEKLNFVFTIEGLSEDNSEWEEDDSDYEENENASTEDEDESVSSDGSSEKSFDESEEEMPKKKAAVKKSVKNNEKKSREIINLPTPMPTSEKSPTLLIENSTSETILEKLTNLLNSNPNDKSIQKCLKLYQEETQKEILKLEKKTKKQKQKNSRIFKKIIKDKNTMNDLSFYEKLDSQQQHKIIKELRQINKITRIEKPYRITLLESNIPVEFKSVAMKKINSLKYMEPGSGEFYKSKNWVDTFMRIPFNTFKGLPISIDDGVDKCHDFMENAKQILDEAVYGLNDAKMQIMQMLGQLLINPNAIGAAIAIHGPPGTGKTSLVKEGISKILNRPFEFIALGGSTDSSFLEGHSYTYEGSTWGRIVQILIDSKCMNPVIYFDELDKISDTPRGEEIAGILTHLTDTSQNSQFHDKYFADINFDLSKCLFIFSYNDENKVSPILRDRMYRIKTKGYISKEKTVIANNYLLPKIGDQVRFKPGEIIIPNDVINHIIETHCNKEDGVRNLKRCFEIIYTKLNLYRLMKPGTNLFEGEMSSLKVEFPFQVTKIIVDKLIKRDADGIESWRSLYT